MLVLNPETDQVQPTAIKEQQVFSHTSSERLRQRTMMDAVGGYDHEGRGYRINLDGELSLMQPTGGFGSALHASTRLPSSVRRTGRKDMRLRRCSSSQPTCSGQNRPY